MAETYSFINADGDTTSLSFASGTQYPNGILGRGMPPMVVLADDIPNSDGSRYRGTQAAERNLAWRATLVASSKSALRARIRALVTALQPRRADTLTGTFRIITEDAVTRDLNCVFSGGLENGSDEGSATMARVELEFFANDPWWYGPTVTQNFTESGAGVEWFGHDWFPFQLSEGAVFDQQTVTNDGDAYSWPIWTITGPVTDLIITNDTTGESFSFDSALSSGSVLVVDTRPNHKSVTLNGVNNFHNLTGSLWYLVSGDNQITIEGSLASGVTVVQLAYQNRYASA